MTFNEGKFKLKPFLILKNIIYTIVVLLFLLLSDLSFGNGVIRIQDSFQLVVSDSITRYYKTYYVDSLGDTVFDLKLKKFPLDVWPNSNSNDVNTWDVPVPGAYSEFGRPYDSTQHFNPRLAAIIAGTFGLFVLYIIYRVRKALKRDKERVQDS